MDRRTKYTKKIIKDTFIDLSSEKDINKVTVSEICKIADINRATFYRYYLDVYDLLDKMEEEFVDAVKNAYMINDSDNVVIYGHNMKNGAMFAELEKYEDKSFYDENSEILRKLRNENIPDNCKECDNAETCRGGLKCLSYAIYGDWNFKDIGCSCIS